MPIARHPGRAPEDKNCSICDDSKMWVVIDNQVNLCQKCYYRMRGECIAMQLDNGTAYDTPAPPAAEEFPVHFIEIETYVIAPSIKQGQTMTTIVDLQNPGVREALIKIGWTPPPATSFSLTRAGAQAIEDALRQQWRLGEYDNGKHGCPHCGRSRLCICPNGKHRCEKCNWVPEDNGYAPVD
jgi:ribosomal protein L37AE/L43A